MEEQRQLEEEWSKRRRPQDVSGLDTSCTGTGTGTGKGPGTGC
jgi:hypothetical protein